MTNPARLTKLVRAEGISGKDAEAIECLVDPGDPLQLDDEGDIDEGRRGCPRGTGWNALRTGGLVNEARARETAIGLSPPSRGIESRISDQPEGSGSMALGRRHWRRGPGHRLLSLVLVTVAAAAVGVVPASPAWADTGAGSVTSESTDSGPGLTPPLIHCQNYRTVPHVFSGLVVAGGAVECDDEMPLLQLHVQLFTNGIQVGEAVDILIDTRMLPLTGRFEPLQASARCAPGVYVVLVTTHYIAPPNYAPPAGYIYTPAESIVPVPIYAKDCLPVIISMSDGEARARIAELGLTVGTVTHQSSSAPVNSVISSSLRTDNTTVDLVESAGNATVPNLIGVSKATAQQRILAAGLTVGQVRTTRVAESLDAGKVWVQTPAAGTPTNVGSAVDISVGVYNGNPGGGHS